MKGKLIGVLAVLLVGLLAMTAVKADVFEDVELDDHELDSDITTLRDYDRGDVLELTFDVVGADMNLTYDLEDVRVEAMIDGRDSTRAQTGRFVLENDRVRSFTLDLDISERMDRDVYNLTLLLTDKTGILTQATYAVSLASGGDDHKLVIKDVIFAPEDKVEAGRSFLATVKVANKGIRSEDDVKVRVAIPELGVSAAAFIDEVEAEDDTGGDDVVVSEELYMRIPSDALTGDYEVIVSAEYDDGDEKVSEAYTISIDGVNPVVDETPVEEPKIQVSYLESMDMTAGSAGKMYPITIVNPTSESKTAVITVDGADAFGEAVVEPSNVVIVGAGETKLVPVYVSADSEAAAGEYQFAVTMSGLSEEPQTVTMVANVAEPVVEEPVVDGWDNVKKGLEIAFVVLVALLVLLGLIIGFGKLRSNDDEDDEAAQTYY